MAIQMEHSTIQVKPMKKLMLPLRKFDDMEDAKDRLRDLQYVLNKNNDNIQRALNSGNRLLDFSIDDEGIFKHQLAKKHFKKDAIDGPSMEKSLKNFVTNIMFTVLNTPPSAIHTLKWAASGVTGAASIIYWPDYGYTNIIVAGTANIPAASVTYAYMKPRDSEYSPLTVASAPPSSIRGFLSDGKIILCQATRGGAVGWRHVNYGGGLHLKV